MMINFSEKKIMVVVAHPDDELLGLGGTMNKLIIEKNATIHVVILGEGLTSRSDKRNIEKFSDELLVHRKNINNACEKIGYQSVSIYDFPDNRFDSIDLLDIVKVIEKEKREFSPDIIFTHHGGDLNIDHRYVFNAVMTACRPLEGEKVKTIITFETPSGTEWRPVTDPNHFLPNFYSIISQDNLNAKIAAMECYVFEKREYPHPRSPKALKIFAQRAGIIIGYELAECFCVVRHIEI